MSTTITYSLATYAGPWNQTSAGHLLRRAMFGPKLSEIRQAEQLGLSGTLDLLLDENSTLPDPPLNFYFTDDPETPIGTTWVDKPYISGKEFPRKKSYRAWYQGVLLNQTISAREKMCLFWLNHFVSEMDNIADARSTYENANLFRENAFGSFQKLVEDVTVSHAMLIYLNGNTNKNGAPNENYARELLELFSIGKGPLIAEGNYTNYTEHDIQQAARVLSGFTTAKNPYNVVKYTSSRHDKGEKVFSEIFGNKAIINGEDLEYKELIQMIFDKEETAKHICRKLYRWFLYYDISDEVELNIITPMAQNLRENNFVIKPALRLLFESEHFFDQNFVGAQIKSPIDFNIGFVRQLEVDFPSENDLLPLYNLWFEIFNSENIQLQSVSDPPDVAGWKAYYQEPSFYRTWISAVTLGERDAFVNKLLSSNGIKKNGVAIKVNPFKILDQLENPSDPNEVITQFTALLLPVTLSEEAKNVLKEALIPGLPDFEWTLEYSSYKNDPTNAEKQQAVQGKLLNLLIAIKNLPAIQLA